MACPENSAVVPVTRSTVSLSLFQQDFWRREQLEPGTFAHLSRAFSVAGPLSRHALEVSLRELLRRHDALACRFTSDEGEQPVAWIDQCPSTALAAVDLIDLDSALHAAEVARLKQLELDSPFDLGRGPLLRATVLRLAENSHILVLTVHHIACDAWSLGVLLNDLGELYSASVEGRVADLTPLPAAFGAAAAWQREATAEGIDGALTYWRDQLFALPAPPELSTRRQVGSVRSYRNARWLFEFAPEVAPDLAELAVRERTTPFMVLLAAFQVTLAAATNREDVLVASLFSGRTRVEYEPMVGLLASPTTFRAQLSRGQSFLELLASTRTVVLDAFEHQAMPVTEVIRRLDLGPEEQVSRSLFSVWLNQIPEPTPLNLSGAAVRAHFPEAQLRYEKSAQTWDADQLAVTLVISADEVLAILDYNDLLLNHADVENLVTTFATVLEQALRDPSQRLADLMDSGHGG